MERLYYQKKAIGVLDVEPQKNNINEYLTKVALLVPSEIVAAYLTMMGFVSAVNENSKETIMWAIFCVCLVLTPLYLNKQAVSGKPKINHLIISTIAFIVWAYVTTGKQLFPHSFDQAVASIVLVLFSVISALIPLSK